MRYFQRQTRDNLVDTEIRNAEMLAALDVSSSDPSPTSIPPPTEDETEVYHLDEHPED